MDSAQSSPRLLRQRPLSGRSALRVGATGVGIVAAAALFATGSAPTELWEPVSLRGPSALSHRATVSHPPVANTRPPSPPSARRPPRRAGTPSAPRPRMHATFALALPVLLSGVAALAFAAFSRIVHRRTFQGTWAMAAFGPSGFSPDALTSDLPFNFDWDPATIEVALPTDGSRRFRLPEREAPPPTFGSLGELLLQDRVNIRMGLYRAPYDAPLTAEDPSAGNSPTGYFEGSETPMGTADLWQDLVLRQVLVPLARFMQSTRCPADTHLLEVGCGDGRLHAFITDNYPDLRTTATDSSLESLSDAILRLATLLLSARAAAGRRPTNPAFRLADPTALPFEGESFDVVVLRFALGPLGAAERHAAAAGACRVLRPGGQLIVLDALQQGDRPHPGGELRPPSVSPDYWDSDVAQQFVARGLLLESRQYAPLAKVLSFRKANVQDRLTRALSLPTLGMEMPLPVF